MTTTTEFNPETDAEVLAFEAKVKEIEAKAARGEQPTLEEMADLAKRMQAIQARADEAEEPMRAEGYSLGFELAALMFEAYGKWALEQNKKHEGKGVKSGVQYYATLSALATLNFNVARSIFHGQDPRIAYEWLSKLGQYSLQAFEGQEDALTTAHTEGGHALTAEDVERQTKEALAGVLTPEQIAAQRAEAREKAKQDRLIAKAMAEREAGAPLN